MVIIMSMESNTKKESSKFIDSNLMEGMVSVRAVLDGMAAKTSDRRIIEIFLSEERVHKMEREYAWLCHRGEEYGFPVTLCPPAEIDARCIGNTHGGIAAQCTARTIPPLSAAAVSAANAASNAAETKTAENTEQTAKNPFSENGFYVMIEGIEDPYNFGYAMRSLYAAGVDGVILPPRNWMSAAGVVCRASAGASERFSMWCAESSMDAVHIFRRLGYQIVCADMEHSVSMYDADLRRPLLLIVGGEKRGISRAVLDLADTVVRLDYGRPFEGALSAASAASILAFEVYRQNRGR
ncbi:MAG: hypothetical protein J6I50_00225 [Clostridia bacterium]|nr:hypothetical protein [Clostridia bacterium]